MPIIGAHFGFPNGRSVVVILETNFVRPRAWLSFVILSWMRFVREASPSLCERRVEDLLWLLALRSVGGPGSPRGFQVIGITAVVSQRAAMAFHRLAGSSGGCSVEVLSETLFRSSDHPALSHALIADAAGTQSLTGHASSMPGPHHFLGSREAPAEPCRA